MGGLLKHLHELLRLVLLKLAVDLSHFLVLGSRRFVFGIQFDRSFETLHTFLILFDMTLSHASPVPALQIIGSKLDDLVCDVDD